MEAPLIPVTKAKYPGSSGMTQGEANETTPAMVATGTAKSIGPEKAVSWNVLARSCQNPPLTASRPVLCR